MLLDHCGMHSAACSLQSATCEIEPSKPMPLVGSSSDGPASTGAMLRARNALSCRCVAIRIEQRYKGPAWLGCHERRVRSVAAAGFGVVAVGLVGLMP